MKNRFFMLIAVAAVLAGCSGNQSPQLTEKELLGKLIFNDITLSDPAGQSCATCHTPETGFADVTNRAISEGAVKGLFSNRNSMTIAYSAFVPALHYNETDSVYVGGLFWDGRNNTLEQQAGEPFLNLLEMGIKEKGIVVQKVKKAAYYPSLVKIYGESESTDSIYVHICDAIAAYERSAEVNPFSSKFDAFIAGQTTLTEQEKQGMELFEGKGLCAQCHITENDPAAGKILFTDYTYDNLGIPKNPHNPYYKMDPQHNPSGMAYIDPGLGAIVNKAEEMGKFRVPTLRNVALSAPYGHNGYFGTLEEIVRFYNLRDVDTTYPAAEYPPTVNKSEMGNLGLTPQEEAAIIAFLHTLTDGYQTNQKSETGAKNSIK